MPVESKIDSRYTDSVKQDDPGKQSDSALFERDENDQEGLGVFAAAFSFETRIKTTIS
ncbi:MAG: hypothetical protein V1714_03880 [Pseudomonadota bacterium]